MSDRPTDPEDPPAIPAAFRVVSAADPLAVEDVALAKLKISYPRWDIRPGPNAGFQAVHRSESGVQIHVVSGDTVSDLASRLLAITSAEQEEQERTQ